MGTILGLGLEGKWPLARAALQEFPTAAYRVQALADLAEIAADADQKDEAKAMVEEAAKQTEAEKGKDMSAWALMRLAELAGTLGFGGNRSDPGPQHRRPPAQTTGFGRSFARQHLARSARNSPWNNSG